MSVLSKNAVSLIHAAQLLIISLLCCIINCTFAGLYVDFKLNVNINAAVKMAEISGRVIESKNYFCTGCTWQCHHLMSTHYTVYYGMKTVILPEAMCFSYID